MSSPPELPMGGGPLNVTTQLDPLLATPPTCCEPLAPPPAALVPRLMPVVSSTDPAADTRAPYGSTPEALPTLRGSVHATSQSVPLPATDGYCCSALAVVTAMSAAPSTVPAGDTRRA